MGYIGFVRAAEIVQLAEAKTISMIRISSAPSLHHKYLIYNDKNTEMLGRFVSRPSLRSGWAEASARYPSHIPLGRHAQLWAGPSREGH